MVADRRRATAADVARAAGVSRATVGFVLNETPGQTIPEATRTKVHRAARRLGYRPHRSAQTLRRGSSRVALLVLPDWPSSATLQRHLDAVGRRLAEYGYAVVTTTASVLPGVPPLWEVVDPEVVYSLAPLEADLRGRLSALGIEHVLPHPDQRTDWVDPTPAAQVDHLVATGRTRLAYVGIDDPRQGAIDAHRREAVAARAAELGLTPIIATALSYSAPPREIAAELVGLGVDGVAAYNDEVAAAVLRSAVLARIAVPGQLGIVGEDNSTLCELTVPTLSRVVLDHEATGRQLADLILAAATGLEIPPGPPATAHVVARESTG